MLDLLLDYSYSADRRHCSDCADAQADLCLRLALIPTCIFCWIANYIDLQLSIRHVRFCPFDGNGLFDFFTYPSRGLDLFTETTNGHWDSYSSSCYTLRDCGPSYFHHYREQ